MDETLGMCLGGGVFGAGDTAEVLTPDEFRKLTEEINKMGLLDEFKSVSELLPAEDMSAERVAAMVQYITEHQTDRLIELLEFFMTECRALFLEAWEATADAEG